jgi:hypothetical protein
MKKIAARQTWRVQTAMIFHSISLLMRADLEKLRWPNCPLRIMLQFVDANVRKGAAATEEASPEELLRGPTPLHHLSCHADPKHLSFNRNQVILGQQLFRHGANANLDASPNGCTSLHIACNTTLLLENRANPNVQDSYGMTSVMATVQFAPGAVKFLLGWSTPPTIDIDIHITDQTGATLLDMVHSTIDEISDPHAAVYDSLDQQVIHAFLLQQWREIEKMLVERGTH